MLPVLLALSLALGTAQAADPIKIGLMGPMTGSWASEGQEMKQVLDLLAEEINAGGGLMGRRLQVISEDDEGDPQKAALAAQRLAAQGVVAVIGTYGSAVTEASQNAFNAAGIIQIANGSTAIRLTEKGLNLFFRTCPRDDEQAKVAADTIRKLGVKKLAILHDHSIFARGLADETKVNLDQAKGVEIVFFDALTPREQDYSAILTRLKDAQPELVFFTGYYGEAGLLLKQSREMGWKIGFMGGDATNNSDLVKIAGKDAAPGFTFLSAPLPKDLPAAEAGAFLEVFTRQYGKPPSSIYAVLAGDGLRVAAHSIGVTRTTDTARLAAFLHQELKDFPGLTGKISFNDKGDRIGEVYRVYKVDPQGRFILQH
jgi:branched-chain amino acid transport system substrate-binding protein